MLRVVETFAGIGSQTKALKNLGISHEVVGISEWDINSILAYSQIHNGKEFDDVFVPSMEECISFLNKFTFSSDGKNPIKSLQRLGKDKIIQLYKAQKATKNLGSITEIKVDDFPDCDLITYSFPCQAISLQGKQEGLLKGSKTSSSLLWEIERILNGLSQENRLPKYLVMENVSNLLSKKFMPFFNEWLDFLNKLGYETNFGLLKASSFDCPQNRERAFAVSVLGKNNFIFPNGNMTTKTLKDIVSQNVESKYFLPHLEEKLRHNFNKIPVKKKSGIRSSYLDNYTTFQSENIVYCMDSIAPTITANGAQSRIKIIDQNNKLRYLTPLEHWRLMGFTENDFNKAKKIISSETILKKQAGNSIPVQLLEAIFGFFKDVE